jgi:hypothetical protein
MSYNAIFAIAGALDLDVETQQMDIKTALLCENINKEAWIE